MAIVQRTKFCLSLGLCVISGFTSMPAMALDKYWACDSSWWDFNCWSSTAGGDLGGSAPGTGDDVYLLQSDALARTVQYANFNALIPELNSLRIDAAGAGNMTLLQSYHDLNVANEYVGQVANGQVMQTGGTHTVTSGLQLGGSASGYGVYNLGGDASLSANGLHVGYEGTGTVNIEDTATLNSNYSYIANRAGSTGTVTVNGTGASWTNQTDLYVGSAGNGSLDIINDGQVTSDDGLVAYLRDSQGRVRVNGSGSNWNVSHDLYIGGLGQADVAIENGGQVSSSNMVLGLGTEGMASVVVDAQGSLLTTGTSYIGVEGSGDVLVQNGAAMNSVTTTMGSGTGQGRVRIEGMGSGWTNTGNVIVGGYGEGELQVTAGAQVQFGRTHIAEESAASGTVTVAGAGSSLVNDSFFNVGGGGQGNLNIQQGGSVSSNHIVAGLLEGSHGVINIEDTGSNLNADVLVAAFGTGEMNIRNGASVTASHVSVGQYANTGATQGQGVINVNGDTSRLDVGGNMILAREGSALLSISDGGQVTNSLAIAASDAGSSASISVSGENASWQNRQDLTLGQEGSAALSINAGAQVSNATAWMASRAGSLASATISDSGSLWQNSRDLRIGQAGTASMNIENGARVENVDGYLGTTAGSIGTAHVEGNNASWHNHGNLYIAGSDFVEGGVGQLRIANGGQVNVDSHFKIWSGGQVDLDGGVLVTDTLENHGQLNFYAGKLGIGRDLAVDVNEALGSNIVLSRLHELEVGGTTTLTGRGSLVLDGGTFTTGSLNDNGGFEFIRGTFNLSADDLTIGNSGLFGTAVQFDGSRTVHVNNNTHVDAGAVLSLENTTFSSATINNQGDIKLKGPIAELAGGVFNNHARLSGDGRISAQLNNTQDADVRVSSGDTLTFLGNNNINAGRLSLLGGTAEFTQGVTNTGAIIGRGTLISGHDAVLNNQGSLAISGRSDVIGDVNNTEGGRIVVSGNSSATFHDDVIHNGSEIRISEGSQAVFFGAVSGAGAYTGTGSVFFEGDLLPGNSPALVSVEGDMSLGLLSHTTIELGGLIRADEYDAFDVGHTLSLAGELEVVNLDLGSGLFNASLGDSFDLFTAETILGEFDRLTFATLTNGLAWQLNYLTDAIGNMDLVRLQVVSAVPVPPAVWLFASGLLGLVSVARRQTSQGKA